MKKTLVKRLLLILTTVVLILSLAACSSNITMDKGNYSDSFVSESETTGDLLENKNVATNRKIIEKIYLSVETKEFDTLLSKIESEIQKSGGYIEKSSVSGEKVSGDRYGSFIIRIPSEQSNSFTAFVSENSTVTNKEIETEDVTLSYIDTESRISALETEKAALEKLLSEATALSDIISIQERLTDVIYEIESYQSQLRTYDSLIDYTTVNVSIWEVERVTVVEEQGMWEEIGTNLKENFENLGYVLKRIFIALVSGLPFILPLVVIGVTVLIIVRISTRKDRKKKAEKQNNSAE